MSATGSLGEYDSELQMFVEDSSPIDLDVLRFMRWLIGTGRLVGDTAPDWEHRRND